MLFKQAMSCDWFWLKCLSTLIAIIALVTCEAKKQRCSNLGPLPVPEVSGSWMTLLEDCIFLVTLIETWWKMLFSTSCNSSLRQELWGCNSLLWKSSWNPSENDASIWFFMGFLRMDSLWYFTNYQKLGSQHHQIWPREMAHLWGVPRTWSGPKRGDANAGDAEDSINGGYSHMDGILWQFVIYIAVV